MLYKSGQKVRINMNNQIIQLEAYRLIRKKARDVVEPVDDAVLGSYVRGVVDLQTELYKLSENPESEDANETTNS